MAGTKVSALPAATVLADADLLPIVDVSDTTQAPTGTTKALEATTVADYVTESDALRESLTYVDVRWFGAIGNTATDYTTEIQDAIDYAVTLQASGGASYPDRQIVVRLSPRAYYNITSLTIPQNVTLKGGELRPTAAGVAVTLNGNQASVEDVLFRAEGAALCDTGVHIVASANKASVRRCVFNGFQGSAIFVEGNVAWIEDCFAQNCVLDDAALASPKGVLHIEGTGANDFWVKDCEFTASNTAMSASGNAYAVVCLGKAGCMDGVIAELSDHGFYINGVHNKWSNCRADLNRGHGWVFAGGDGDLSTCQSLSNGRETTNTYDGFNITGGSYRFSACSADVLSTLTAVQHRYGFNSTATSTTGPQFDASCYSNQHATAAIAVAATGGRVIPTQGPFINTSGTGTSWNVQTYRWPHTCWNLAAGSARNLSDLTFGVSGMRVTLRGDGNTTLVHNSPAANKLFLKGGVNVLAAANTFYEFVNASGVWFEV